MNCEMKKIMLEMPEESIDRILKEEGFIRRKFPII